MAGLYEDSDLIGRQAGEDQAEPARRDALFYRGANQPGRYNRYQPGYSSHPRHPGQSANQQPWALAPIGGYGHDIPRYHQDDELRRMVEESIKADPHLSDQEKQAINVTVENGQVTLRGRVKSREVKDQVESDVNWTEGVGAVQSQIEVSG